MPEKKEPTEEQQAAIEAARGASESLMLTAYAGTGKTSTLEMMAHEAPPRPSLALAFNKKIVEELKPRLPDNFTVKSLNGLGHGAWMRRPGMPSLRLEQQKVGKLITELAKESKTRLSSEQWQWTKDAVGKAQLRGLVPQKFASHAALYASEASRETWDDIFAEAGVPSDEWNFICGFAEEVLKRDIELALQGVISFDDQIYCPTILGGFWPKYPEVLIDESQDLSWLNQMMLKEVVRAEGRLTAVGDPLQAIYAFRGADHESMKSLRKLRSEWRDLPLTMTFRCPQEIVRRQQQHARGFRAASSNREGRFAIAQSGDFGWDLNWVRTLSRSPEIAVLCRNNGPLLSLAFKCLRQGIGVNMLGRDIGRGLLVLSRKLCPTDEMTREACAASIREWQERETSLALANNREEAVDSITDRAECLLAVLESAEARDAGQLRSLLEQLFARESGVLTLSSIHRSKGLEWEVVVHLDPWRLPSKWAKRAAAAGDERQMRQEQNLRYVCETRTKDVLINANLEDFR